MGPIGIFDSGYGGLTILADIKKKLPEYDYIYLGDNARAPYGTRSFDVIYDYTLEAVQELFDRGCHLVILACNTASAKALRTIQQKDLNRFGSDKKVLGVIRPSTEVVGNYSKSNKIGILATQGTVESNSYKIEINKFYPECEVFQHACPLWVPLIEDNAHNTEEGKAFIKKDVELLLQKESNIDTIVLGCTHYPILLPYLISIVPKSIKIIAQGEIVANSLLNYLNRHSEVENLCSKNSTTTYLTTESKLIFDKNALQYLNTKIDSIHLNCISKR